MVHLGKELRVEGEAAVKFGVGFGNKPHGELALEHQHRAPEDGPVEEQLEYKARRDLVGERVL